MIPLFPFDHISEANNVTSPSCCPSTFSTSTGCVCSTKNQRDFIAARGMLDGGEASDEVEVSEV